ncbi:hypothetical protein CS022_19780 [Veronia nyctiphanis]|uniref:Uncharacterized protein n=1 Tax=Veronia nyctiphanis TaxID=1278244 RepID=A0A4Q0YLW2_9GAMM|nr:hypothetical protein [Veronia nyctiphanis]RXJ71807.1 hypothetical protein CS022_19780 [Veronia nyctiphanis]
MIAIGENRLPFFARNRTLVIDKLEVLARCEQEEDYHLRLAFEREDGTFSGSTNIHMVRDTTLNGLHRVSVVDGTGGLDFSEFDVSHLLSVQMKKSSDDDFRSLC